MTALYHFIRHGAGENRNPHPLFDTAFVRAQLGDRTGDPLLAYEKAPRGSYQPHQSFDEQYVLNQISGADRSKKMTVLAQFLMNDAETWNPSSSFDMKSYRSINPDIRDLNSFYHYIRWGKNEGRLAVPVNRSISDVEKQIENAASLDPDIVPPHSNLYVLSRIEPLNNEKARSLLNGLIGRVGEEGVDCVFLAPSLNRGGAERVLINVISTFVERGLRVALLLTDARSKEPISWLPRDSNLTVFSFAEFADDLARQTVIQIVVNYLQVLRPKSIYVCNSAIGWALIERHGSALKLLFDIHVFAFCYDYDEHGRRGGYAWTHLGHIAHVVKSIITDNAITPSEISDDLSLDENERSKFVVLYQPADARLLKNWSNDLHTLDLRSKRRLVLWAGRFSRQKNVKLALEIASIAIDLDFVFAGISKDQCDAEGWFVPSNTTFLGEYDHFHDLPLHRVSAFLYTSLWDGLPNVIIEAGSAGLPIVAPNVGGVSDLIDNETGFLLSSSATANEFHKSLREAVTSGKDKSYALTEKIIARHSKNMFTETLLGSLASPAVEL